MQYSIVQPNALPAQPVIVPAPAPAPQPVVPAPAPAPQAAAPAPLGMDQHGRYLHTHIQQHAPCCCLLLFVVVYEHGLLRYTCFCYNCVHMHESAPSGTPPQWPLAQYVCETSVCVRVCGCVCSRVATGAAAHTSRDRRIARGCEGTGDASQATDDRTWGNVAPHTHTHTHTHTTRALPDTSCSVFCASPPGRAQVYPFLLSPPHPALWV